MELFPAIANRNQRCIRHGALLSATVNKWDMEKLNV